MKISIVIPTYNHCDDLLKPCIESIVKYTDFTNVEVIVSANGCKDNTKEYVESLGKPFKLVWNEEAIGFSRATNAGIEAATGDYIVLLNNDIVLLQQEKNKWLDLLREPFIDDKVGVTGPLKGPSEPAGRDFIIFFCCMIARKVFNKIGLLDTIFGVGGGEDTDFCIKAEDAGYKLVQVPKEPLITNKSFMIGGFPIYHKGEGTVHDPNCVTGWSDIFDKNSDILRERYNRQWKLGNNAERAVIGKNDSIPEREHTRYSWAKENIVGTKVLEIGCSSGYGWRYFKDIPNIDYLGIDKDEGVIEFAKEHFGEHFQVADINKFKFEQYDTIIAFEVLEHLDNGKELAQKLKKHCKCLLATVPYKETPGFWGQHHKLFQLTQKDFPEFESKFINTEGKICNTPDKNAEVNLLLMKWEKGKTYNMPKPTITAVIPTKNRYYTTLPLAISSVINQTVKPNKLLIIDDGEKIDLRKVPTYEYLFKTLDKENIKWEVLFANGKGIAHSHQLSINKSETDLIWRLDDDCVAKNDVLEKLLASMTDEVGAVGGCVLDPKHISFNSMASNKIEDIYLGVNEQWYQQSKEVKEVDHLYSSFLYRKEASKHGYCLELSSVGHREETTFTYEMKRAGWKLLFNPKAVTYHYRNPEGGIREKTDASLWQHDENIFLRKMIDWKVIPKQYKYVVLDAGLGDHYAFNHILPELIDKYGEENLILAVCYRQVFKEYNVKLISIAEAQAMWGNLEDKNIYKFMWDRHWSKSLTEAYREMYI
jgi:GT2 family glycosyltransferase